MSYEFYKVLHITGIFMVISAVGAHLLNGMLGGNKQFAGRKFVSILHGIGLLIAFVAGFGLMARLGMMGAGWPIWVTLKMVIWLFLGVVILIPRYKPTWSKAVWIAVIIVGSFAAYLARYKPY
jgi:hypothetical protein